MSMGNSRRNARGPVRSPEPASADFRAFTPASIKAPSTALAIVGHQKSARASVKKPESELTHALNAATGSNEIIEMATALPPLDAEFAFPRN